MSKGEPSKCKVEYAIGGSAKDDLAKLKKKSPRVYIHFDIIFKHLKTGRPLSNSKYKLLNGFRPVSEIKCSIKGAPYRCFCYKELETYYLTHCCKKKSSKKWVGQQAEKALEIRKKHKAATKGEK